MSDSFSLDITLNQADLDRLTKRLDKWKGKPLAVRMDAAARAGMGLFIGPLKARAGRHNMTAAEAANHRGERYPSIPGAVQKGYAVRKLRQRNYTEIAQYKAGSNYWARPFAIVGTSMGVKGDPYVAQVHQALEPRVVAFIDQQITRLA